jgi:hypothetical protein
MSLTLVPQFGIPPVVSQEYVFIIDRSGSMKGQSMKFAKDALQVLLRSLPAHGTFFNVASFGTHFESLWEKSQVYGEASLSVAVSVDYDQPTVVGLTLRIARPTTLKLYRRTWAEPKSKAYCKRCFATE